MSRIHVSTVCLACQLLLLMNVVLATNSSTTSTPTPETTTVLADQTVAEARRTGAVFSSDTRLDGQDSILDARSVWEEATQAIFKHRPLGIMKRRTVKKSRRKAEKKKDQQSTEPDMVKVTQPQVPHHPAYGFPYFPSNYAMDKGPTQAVFLSPFHTHQHHQQVLPPPMVQSPGSFYEALIQPSHAAAASMQNSFMMTPPPYMPGHLSGHPLMPARSPVFIVHLPKPPIAVPYDPLIIGGIPHNMIPIHPLPQIINHHDTHLNHDQARDEVENRKDGNVRRDDNDSNYKKNERISGGETSNDPVYGSRKILNGNQYYDETGVSSLSSGKQGTGNNIPNPIPAPPEETAGQPNDSTAAYHSYY